MKQPRECVKRRFKSGHSWRKYDFSDISKECDILHICRMLLII